ncbi:serine hydrolase [Arthrobacter sp. UYEF3]|uniref:serine hydrolase n=1 Tax=Arthrobacter sp. UYEF3 TaxID=1756365 RepID=UPI0033941312
MNTPGPPTPAPASAGVKARRRLVAVGAATTLLLAGAVTAGALRTGPDPKTDFWATLHSQLQPLPGRSAAASAPPAVVDLAAEMRRIQAENPDYRIGVVIQDTRGGEPQAYGDVAAYKAASTAKIITAAAYYHLVETGEKSLETQLGSFSAAFQLQAMVNTSSDDSWLLLMQDIGYPRLIEYAASLGISYDPEQNLLTPAAMALLLKQLYAGQLLSPEHTEELLGYMQDTNDEELIPAAVPQGITVNHKYGVVQGYVHDAAVLRSGDAAYAVAIYTWGDEDADSPDRIDVIHQLTTAVAGSLFRR